MVSKRSAGVLPVRWVDGRMEVFLVHPGGPFFRKKDEGAWSIPKGLLEPSDEDPLDAARRELTEETGLPAPEGSYVELGGVRQKGGKWVEAWAVQADLNPDAIVSNTFSLEWPPRSGRQQQFPEIDRAAWFDLETARRKILPAQAAFLERLVERQQHLSGR